MVRTLDELKRCLPYLLTLSVLCILVLAREAFAEPIQDVAVIPTQQQVNTQDVESLNKTLGEISGKLDKLDEIDASVDALDGSIQSVSEGVSGVSGQVDSLITQQANPEPQIQQLVTATNQSLSFTAYSNVSPTNQFAVYAQNTIPKMGWSDDYIFLQDSSSSYVLVYGDLDFDSVGYFTGQGCTYIRWYYSGNVTGYLVQSGTADVSIDLAGHSALSNLGDYPLLDNGFNNYRQEVCFYALIAVCVYSLHSVWNFLLRYRSGS